MKQALEKYLLNKHGWGRQDGYCPAVESFEKLFMFPVSYLGPKYQHATRFPTPQATQAGKDTGVLAVMSSPLVETTATLHGRDLTS